MDFRRSNNRRRRNLLEEREAAPRRRKRTKAALPAPIYADAALDENQPPLTDLIFRWDLTFAGSILLAAASVGGLIALDMAAPGWSEALGGLDLSALRLSGGGTLAAWLKSALLALAVGFCLLIYQVRRYKTDDYRGTYLIWLWAAASLLLASVDCAVDLQGIARRVLVRLTQTPLHADGAAWGAIAVAVFYTPLVLRLSLEVWPSKPALIALGVAAALHAVATFIGLQLPGMERFEGEAWVVGGGIVLGHWFLFLAVAFYARFVYFDAQGLYARADADAELDEEDDDEEEDDEEEEATEKKTASTGSGVTIHRSEPTTASSSPTTFRRFDSSSTPSPSSSSAKSQSDDEDDDDDSSTSGGRQLSKAERKRLRRLGKL